MNARRSASGRRRTQGQAPSAEARLDLVKRARQALPTLSTDSLYRIHDLLERVLEEPKLDPRTFDELERALEPPAR